MLRVKRHIEHVCVQSDLGGSETGTWAAAVIVDQLKGIRTPDDLVILFSEMAELLHDAPSPEENTHGFDPHSAIGHYLRCCLAAFNELTFEVCYQKPLECMHAL